jgi:hypothetical protein
LRWIMATWKYPAKTYIMSNQRDNKLVAAVFGDPQHAQSVVEQLIDRDFPMDQVSLLHRAGGHGDDFLGLAYDSEGERIKVWGQQGAFWGALGGLLAGVSGLLLVPGVGALLVAGPMLDMLAGAVTGAGLMLGAAAVTRVTIALRRAGIPEDKLEELHQAVMDGKTLLILHCGDDDPQQWLRKLRWEGADPVLTLP